jgi:hypothetical protein
MIDINEKFLDDDQLWFCCKHGLSVNKEDYTEAELKTMTFKAMQEEMERKQKNHNKLIDILKGE